MSKSSSGAFARRTIGLRLTQTTTPRTRDLRPPRPFQIKAEHLAARDLEPETLGLWCVPVSGCWHLFSKYAEAARARAAFIAGRPPR